jgi:hypothetical protein
VVLVDASDRQRAVIAIFIGIAAGALAGWLRLSGRSNFSDFDHLWVGARALLSGADPYAAVESWGYRRPLYYPIPAIIVVAPFALLPMVVAYAIFVGVSVGVFAFAVSASGWWPILTLLSAPTIHAITLGQWSLVDTGIAALPSFAWLAIIKPTTAGAIALAYFLTVFQRRAVLVNAGIALGLIGASSIIVPDWPHRWLAAVVGAQHFMSPAGHLIGVPLLLSVLRWRRPEARLLLLLALVPQSLATYDAAPLALIVRTRLEAVVFVLGGLVTNAMVRPVEEFATLAAGLQDGAPVLIACLYLPTLVMVLRRRNEGDLPTWMERATVRLPRWLRGTPTPVAT